MAFLPGKWTIYPCFTSTTMYDFTPKAIRGNYPEKSNLPGFWVVTQKSKHRAEPR